MNSIYLLVEGGRTEPILYSSWLPHLLPGFVQLLRPEDSANAEGFYIVAGYGYPSILNRIEAALDDVSAFPGFSRLVVALDCEDRSAEEVEAEVRALVPSTPTTTEVDVVVANCAIESWLLGNRKFVKRSPATEPLISYRRGFDVTRNDPELMPNLLPMRFNTRAQFHKEYLKAAFREHGLTYSEARPGPATSAGYLQEIIARANDGSIPQHLSSFSGLLYVLQAHCNEP